MSSKIHFMYLFFFPCPSLFFIQPTVNMRVLIGAWFCNTITLDISARTNNTIVIIYTFMKKSLIETQCACGADIKNYNNWNFWPGKKALPYFLAQIISMAWEVVLVVHYGPQIFMSFSYIAYLLSVPWLQFCVWQRVLSKINSLVLSFLQLNTGTVHCYIFIIIKGD